MLSPDVDCGADRDDEGARAGRLSDGAIEEKLEGVIGWGTSGVEGPEVDDGADIKALMDRTCPPVSSNAGATPSSNCRGVISSIFCSLFRRRYRKTPAPARSSINSVTTTPAMVAVFLPRAELLAAKAAAAALIASSLICVELPERLTRPVQVVSAEPLVFTMGVPKAHRPFLVHILQSQFKMKKGRNTQVTDSS
jgi:hypothetical protein